MFEVGKFFKSVMPIAWMHPSLRMMKVCIVMDFYLLHIYTRPVLERHLGKYFSPYHFSTYLFTLSFFLS